MPAAPPVVLTIAGSDSSCGAGAQADLKTIAALGGYGLNALTSVVAETPGNVSSLRLLDPEIITDQLSVLFAAFPIRAVKTGMLGGRAQVEAVVAHWRSLGQTSPPLVVDPVMVATGGGKLLEDDAVECIASRLLPLARVITPNLDEARVLSGQTIRTRDEMAACATELSARHGTAVLLKGGHLEDDDAADVLCDAGTLHWFSAPRTHGVHTHGTGCAYSAAIATGLAKGLSLHNAVDAAKQFISRAIASHLAWRTDAGEVHALNHLGQS
jgi:hydroxymethylpyrimidine/phosphomethylpyrimidine kinase